MPTYTLTINGLSWATGRTVVARFCDASTGATVLDLPLTEPVAQEYYGTSSATTSATTFTVEARDCATANTAGFDASTTIVLRPETYVPPSSTLSGGGGGSVLGQTTFRLGIYNASGVKFDPPGLTGVTLPNGVVVRGTSTVVVVAGTAFTRTGTGTWTGPTITDSASGLTYEWTARLTYADGSTIDDDRVTDGSTSAESVYVAPTGYPTTTNAALFLAQKTLLVYMTAASTNPGGVARVAVDGQDVQYFTPAELTRQIDYWKNQVALLSGTRRRTFGIRLDGF